LLKRVFALFDFKHRGAVTVMPVGPRLKAFYIPARHNMPGEMNITSCKISVITV
jgi:hypothetical protein